MDSTTGLILMMLGVMFSLMFFSFSKGFNQQNMRKACSTISAILLIVALVGAVFAFSDFGGSSGRGDGVTRCKNCGKSEVFAVGLCRNCSDSYVEWYDRTGGK